MQIRHLEVLTDQAVKLTEITDDEDLDCEVVYYDAAKQMYANLHLIAMRAYW